jgi:methanogenic corrinoid protein MtbC1
MLSPTTADLITAILEIREDEISGIVEAMLAEGADPASIVDTCREAMNTVGQRFEAGEAFIPELIMAGEMMRGISEQVRPHLKEGGESENVGCVVLGTVKGDIHDIGKDIVGSILDAAGFEVVDLGVDVPAERFVDAIGDRADCIVGLSCLLTSGFDSMRTIIAALVDSGVRDRVKVMVGGAPITDQVCSHVAADGWGTDAASALDLAQAWANGDSR